MAFTEILNLSLSASWLVLAIALLRLLLKKAPKALHCALWALVAIRLLCPVSIESGLSLIPSREIIPQQYLTMEPSSQIPMDTPARLEIVSNPIYDTPITLETDATIDRLQHWDLFATVIWLGGMGAMGIYAAYSFLSLRLRVRMAAWIQGNVYECDEIGSPFILGLLRPRIYLPSGMDEITANHVLAHENAHLKRLDHLWKPLGFLLLTVHWFNPIMWLGYILLCRDIELACDERVIRKLDRSAVRSYSEALIRCSVSHRSVTMCPLAFGEVGVKGRIKAMLHDRKPGFWGIALTLAASAVLAVCFLTDPVAPEVSPVPQPNVVDTITNYAFEGDELRGPRFQLHPDGTFLFSENPLSSYLGYGTYTLSGDLLVMKTGDGHCAWTLEWKDGVYHFDADHSSIVQWYPDLKNLQRLPNGARFVQLDMPDSEVEPLLEIICSSPAQSSNPGAYIEAHPTEYARLVELDSTTVSWCFQQFAKGGQTDLRGHIMAIACREIIGKTDLTLSDTGYMTGQDWFDAFARYAQALREELGTQEFSKFHPWHAMALEILGI